MSPPGDSDDTHAPRRRLLDDLPTIDDPPTTEVGFALAEKVVGGRFRLGERLSWGGMGTVFRALDLLTQREVAVKIPHLGDPLNDTRFQSETEAVASVVCSSVIAYVAHGSDDEPFLAMELVQGAPLWKHLQQGALHPTGAAAIARRISSALAAIHLGGWVHRDIKPGNIVVATDGSAKLLDFGLSRPIEGDAGITANGQLVGTLGYMAPEQLRAGWQVNPRCDVYSLGVVVWECLTGRRAFRRSLADVAMGKIDPPLEVGELGLDAPLAGVLRAALATDPDERPEDGLDFLVRWIAAVEPAFAEAMGGAIADLREAALLVLRTGAVHVASTEGADVEKKSAAVGRVLAEMVAPSAVVRLECDPSPRIAPGGHAAALAALLDRLGDGALAARLRERRATDGPAARSLVVVVVDPVWCDEASAAILLDLASSRAFHLVLASTFAAPIEGPFAAVPRVELDGAPSVGRSLAGFASRADERGDPREGGSLRSPRPHSPALDPMQRWCLRAAAMFGRKFDARGVRHLVGGAEGRDASAVLAATAHAGLLRTAGAPGAYAFESGAALGSAIALAKPHERRLGEKLARAFVASDDPALPNARGLIAVEAACSRLAGLPSSA